MEFWSACSPGETPKPARTRSKKVQAIPTGAHLYAAQGSPSTALVCSNDRIAVLVLDLVDVPRTAGRTAAERVYAQLKLISRLQGLARPTVADQPARRAAFEIPKLVGAVFVLDVQNDEGVRAGITKFLHRAGQLDRML